MFVWSLIKVAAMFVILFVAELVEVARRKSWRRLSSKHMIYLATGGLLALSGVVYCKIVGHDIYSGAVGPVVVEGSLHVISLALLCVYIISKRRYLLSRTEAKDEGYYPAGKAQRWMLICFYIMVCLLFITFVNYVQLIWAFRSLSTGLAVR